MKIRAHRVWARYTKVTLYITNFLVYSMFFVAAGPYVALTLLGPPYPPQESTTTPTIIPSSNTSSGSRPPSKMVSCSQ